MANRDVSLVIRAKNEASKNLEKVAESLKVLEKAQGGVAASSPKLDAQLSAMSDELARLKTAEEAAAALDKAKAAMDVAEKSAARLNEELAKADAEFKSMGEQASVAEKRLTDLRATQSALIDRQRQEKAAVEEATKAVSKQSQAYKEALAAKKQLQTALANPTVDGMMAALNNPATANYDMALAQRDQAKANLKTTSEELKRVNIDTQAANRSFRALSGSAKHLQGNFEELQAAEAEARKELDGIETAVLKGMIDFERFGFKAEEAAKKTSTLTGEIARLGAVTATMGRYATGTGSFTNPATAAKLQAATGKASAAQSDWQTLEAEAKRLAIEMKNTSGNITELSNRLNQTVAAARAAKQEYLGLAAAAHKLGGAGQSASPMFANPTASAARQARLNYVPGAASSSSGAANATRDLAKANTDAYDAMLKLNRESRQSMSLFQRMRGQVLSLAAAYVGLFGSISALGFSINAFQTLEAAQNRLGVVFEQNSQKIGTEMTWLQAQSSRLGIDFGVLSNQYSKFAVSAQAAGFTVNETRKVFMSLAEAGRVNKLSIDDMNGVFLAAVQMIQKSKVSAEELRGQMAERLPGAVNIFADALGVTTSELSKMMEQGQVLANSSTMVKFADELTEKFGPQLSKSLEGTSANIGKFQNNLFQAAVQFGNGGFIDAFNRMMEKLNAWFQSRAGHDFFMTLGAAAGNAADFVGMMVDNVDLIISAAQTLVAIKMGQWLGEAIGGFGRFGSIASATLTKTNAQMFALSNTTLALRVGLSGSRAATLALSGAMGVLRVGMIAVNSVALAFGGWINILAIAASLFATPMLMEWAGGVDDVNRAADEHKRIMDAVLGKYDQVKDKAGQWGDVIKSVTLDQANSNFRSQFDAYRTSLQELINGALGGAMQLGPGFDELRQLAKDLDAGSIKVGDFTKKVRDLYAASDDEVFRKFAEEFLKSADAASESADRTAVAAEVAQNMGSTLADLNAGLSVSETRLVDTAEAADGFSESMTDNKSKLADFQKAMEDMDKAAGRINGTLKDMSDRKAIEEAFKGAVDAAISIGQVTAAIYKYNEALDSLEQRRVNGVIDNGIVGKIIGVESAGVADAQNQNSTATGLGQFIESTWLEMFKKYFPDQATGMTDAAILELRKNADYSKQMVAFYLQENAKALQAAGVAVTDTNLYLAHFLGAGGATALLKAAPGTPVSSVLGADQIAANQSILSGKTTDQVIAWADQKMGAGRTPEEMNREIAVAEELVAARRAAAEAARKEAEETAKSKEAVDKSLADLGFENDMLKMKIAGKTKEAYIEEQIARMKEGNKEFDAAAEARARSLLASQYDLNEQLEKQKDTKTEIEGIEKTIADLQKQKTGLTDQRDILKARGDTSGMASIDGQLSGVNSKLDEAIKKAIAFYQAMGGTEGAAAVAELQAMQMGLAAVNQNAEKFRFTYEEIKDSVFNSLESGVVDMFKAFAEAVANGENAVKSLGRAFRQFAANFLMEMAQMILKQALFNAISGFTKAISGGLGGIMGVPVLTAHTGALIGASTGSSTISASPAWFQNAVRYHSGGIAGLAPNEVPAVLKKGEEVLTQDNPRHARNAGASGGAGKSTKIVNAFDSASFLAEALKNTIGEEVILNYVRANPAAWKQAMEG